MRVLHVSEVAWGGVVSLLRDFTSEQAARGHEVTLLAPPAFPNLPDPSVRRLEWGIERGRPATWRRALGELRAAVRQTRPDVVHLHSAFAGFLGRLPLLSLTGAVPVVYQPHAWSFDAFSGATARTLAQLWERLAARRTQVLVGNCDDEIDQGRRHGVRTPGHALGVPIDVERFHLVPDAERDRWRAETGATASRMVLCLGRLARQKGQDLLVAEWERQPLPDAELVLVGPGDPAPLRALAPQQWDKTVRWVGDQADVRPFLWASDVLVLASRYETVAVVVAEAMACGRPVVAAAVNGTAMAVTDGPWPAGGVVVSLGDTAGLLAATGELLAQPDRARALGAAGRDRVVGTFTPRLVVDRLDTAYQAAVEAVR